MNYWLAGNSIELMRVGLGKGVKKWLWVVVLVPSLILNFFLFNKNLELKEGILVLAVLDGDTLLLDGKVKLRLRHIDAPELEFCGGQEAQEILEKLAQGKKVVLKEKILDQYGRDMALVYVGQSLLNLKMLESGWARYHSDSSSVAQELKQAGDQAKEAKIGIFSSQCWLTENSEDPSCDIKGNIDKNSTARKYYFPGCSQYEFTIVEKDLGEDFFCSEEEARKAGFTRSETCFKLKYKH